MTPLTVGELAERIREPGEHLAPVIQRLRFFTSTGLLKTVGQRDPGTGRKRLYPPLAVVDAAILSKLSLLFGIPASKVVLFGNALTMAREAAGEFEGQLQQGHLIYLTLGVVRDLRGRPKTLVSDLQYVADIDVPTDITGPSMEVGAAPDDDWAQRQVLLHKNFDFGLIINLTSMFKRIGLGGTSG